ncbi:MAG: EpsG family protein [Colwellia sp.]|jgi:hypothetical protein
MILLSVTLLFFIFVSMVYIKSCDPNGVCHNGQMINFLVGGLILLVCLIVASRELISDSEMYFRLYTQSRMFSLVDYIGFSGHDPAYFFTSWFFSFLGIPYEVFLFFICLALFSSYSLWFRAFEFKSALPFLILIISTPVFFSLSAHTLRQSLAVTFLLVALLYLDNKKPILVIFLCVIAILFHRMTAPACLLIVFLMLRGKASNKVLLYSVVIWFISVLLSITGLLKPILIALVGGFFQEERVYIYFDNSFTGERVGFLLDFFIYSSIPLLLFPFISKEVIDKHGNLFVFYLLLNSLYFLLNFIPFSSRIANLSWCVIPIFMAVFVSSSPIYKRYSKLADLLLICLAIPAFKYNYWLLS